MNAPVTLADARKAAGLSQHSLAELIGVSQGALAYWERGQAAIPKDRLGALAFRLGVPQDAIAARQPLKLDAVSRVDAVQCGTYSGAITHVRRGEKACGPCAQARREYQASRRIPHPRPPAQCGTNRGYHAHRWRGQEPCVACRVAHAAYERQRQDGAL